MKHIFSCIVLFAACLLTVSCKKDNYEEPSSLLSGKLVYKGDPIGLENYQVPFELYQYGFGKLGRVGANSKLVDGVTDVGDNATTFDQNGAYSMTLFNGTYKILIPNGQGPFKWKQLSSGAPDSLTVTMSGNQTLNLEVTPYYMIWTPALTGGGGKVNATFKTEKIITDAANAKDIEKVTLYVSKTQFVSADGNNNIAQAELAGSAITNPNSVALTVTVPNIAPQTYVFARIGLKIAGVEDVIYSPVTQVTF